MIKYTRIKEAGMERKMREEMQKGLLKTKANDLEPN